jgi:hypothetical protein
MMEYSDLITKAANTDDPDVRMSLIVAFGASQYAAHDGRLSKPFNPLLGETYELLTPKYRLFAEQVSHHPPITAIISESDLWNYETDSDAKIVFNGTYVKAIPNGEQVVRLKNRKEVYVISRPITFVNNILFGTMYNEQVGMMRIREKNSGRVAEIEFKAEGWGGKNKHDISGYLYPSEEACKAKERSNTLFYHGKYTQFLHAWKTDKAGKHGNIGVEPDMKLWEANPRFERQQFYYNLTKFAMSLNYLPETLVGKLPPSDCRFRPDLRAYEEGKMEFAGEEKFRLEEKQRLARRRRAAGEIPEFEPKYFQKEFCEETGLTQYVYGKRRDYWRDRRKGDFAHMEDIY